MYAFTIMCALLSKVISVQSEGVMILYRPKDITKECVNSHLLRYDLSFGMGLSDTITVIFRTLNEIDYECAIDIVTELNTVLIVVIKYPNWIAINCASNRYAFGVVYNNVCYPLCDEINYTKRFTFNYILRAVERIHLRFSSNSTINNNMNAIQYQVTATTARRSQKGCLRSNETTCVIRDKKYCFTNGVACDGIKNCGVEDWYDEKKSECGLPHARLNKMAVVAVIAALFLAVLAGGHWILKCLPPVATSFFIFHSNEDNRLYIQPVYKPNKDADGGAPAGDLSTAESSEREKPQSRRTTTMKAVATRLQERFRAVTRRPSPPRSAYHE